MKRIKTLLLGITTILFFQSLTLAQALKKGTFANEAKLHFDNTVQKLGIPGFSVVVVQGDKTLLAEGFGLADVERKQKANKNTEYYIASATKSFTALLAVILDSEGILKLDATLDQYFLDLALDSTISLKNISLRDLLTHTSGIENSPISWRLAYSGNHNISLLWDLMKYTTPNSAGLGNYEYTNFGYNIYTLILEKKTGKSWQNWMQEKIFDPLKMDHTTAFISKAEKQNWILAKPYIVTDTLVRIALEKKDNTMQSAGGIVSTPSDMAKWLQVQIGRGKLNGKQIFPEAWMAESQKELVKMDGSKRLFQPDSYGYGWMHGKVNGFKVMHHFGGFAGFSSHVSFIPEKGIAVVVMVNEAMSGDRLTPIISTFIYDHLMNGKSWSEFDEEVNKFSAKLTEGRKMMSAGAKERSKRPFLLTKPMSQYAGTYASEEYGTLEIRVEGNSFKVSAGNMNCIATAFKNENSIRVELIPGVGQVIQFLIDENVLSGLVYDNVRFERAES